MSDFRKCVPWRLKIDGIETELSGAWSLMSGQGEEGLAARVESLGLSSRFAAAFPRTAPAYYGWFIDSPLNIEQATLLREIIGQISASGVDDAYGGRTAFEAALSVAVSVPSTLAVELSKPGHADFGVVTIYCHCPRCKAPTAGMPPWPDRAWRKANPDADSVDYYPIESVDCTVCGFRYSPASTYSSRTARRRDPVECVNCHASIAMETLSEEDVSVVMDHQLKLHFIAEARTIGLVKDFMTRHGIDQGELKSFQDNSYLEALTARAEREQWASVDQSIIRHLDGNRYLPEPRLGFVNSRIAEIKDTVVMCPNCHGCLY